jgi:hypothetical protein
MDERTQEPAQPATPNLTSATGVKPAIQDVFAGLRQLARLFGGS